MPTFRVQIRSWSPAWPTSVRTKRHATVSNELLAEPGDKVFDLNRRSCSASRFRDTKGHYPGRDGHMLCYTRRCRRTRTSKCGYLDLLFQFLRGTATPPLRRISASTRKISGTLILPFARSSMTAILVNVCSRASWLSLSMNTPIGASHPPLLVSLRILFRYPLAPSTT